MLPCAHIGELLQGTCSRAELLGPKILVSVLLGIAKLLSRVVVPASASCEQRNSSQHLSRKTILSTPGMRSGMNECIFTKQQGEGNRCALFSQQGNGDVGPPAAKELNSVNEEMELGGESQAPEENAGCWYLEFGFMRP